MIFLNENIEKERALCSIKETLSGCDDYNFKVVPVTVGLAALHVGKTHSRACHGARSAPDTLHLCRCHSPRHVAGGILHKAGIREIPQRQA